MDLDINHLKSDIYIESFPKDETQCRTCTKSIQSQLFFLFKDTKTMEMFVACTNLELYKADGLPEYICEICYNQMIKYHSFRVQCASADLFFRQNLLQDAIFNDEMDNYDLDGLVPDDDNEENEIVEEKLPSIIEVPIKDDKIQEYVSELKKFICDLCNERIYDKAALRKHFKKSHRPEFRCTQCDKIFGFQHNLKRHIDETHLNIRQRSSSKFTPKSCEICGKKFLKPHYYEGHMRQHNGLDPFECIPCSRTFAKYVTLNHHNQLHHNSIILPKHSCQLDGCSKMYKTIDSLRAHQKLIHQNNLSAISLSNYICEYCGKSFTKRFVLKEHMYRHTGQPFSCHLCSKKFYAKYSLKMHLRRHDGIKSYSCPICGLQKHTGSELKAHINQHTQEKKYPCQECTAVFDAHANLYSHIRSVHKMLKPYKCTYCHSAFKKSDHLKSHIMIHTNEKPHVCLICNHRFIQKSALKKHMRTHTKVKV